MKTKFSKKDLWVLIIFSVMGLINLFLYLILGLSKVTNYETQRMIFNIIGLVLIWMPLLLPLINLKLNFILLVCYEIFLIISLFLGSVWNMYDLWSGYDMITHVLSGVLIAIIAYCLLRDNVSGLGWLILVCFSVAVMCGGLWEIWEFVTDDIIGNNAQRTAGLVGRTAVYDTMWDIICDTIGAIAGAVSIIFFERRNIGNR